jgi:hypothetical protein
MLHLALRASAELLSGVALCAAAEQRHPGYGDPGGSQMYRNSLVGAIHAAYRCAVAAWWPGLHPWTLGERGLPTRGAVADPLS